MVLSNIKYMELSCYSPTNLKLKMFSHIMYLN